MIDINPVKDAKRDAEELVNVVSTAIYYIKNMLEGNAQFSEFTDTVTDYSVSMECEKNDDFEGHVGKAVKGMTSNLFNLYQFVASTVDDTDLILETKKTLSILYVITEKTLPEVGARGHDMRLGTLQLDDIMEMILSTRLVRALEYAQAKIKVNQEGKITIPDLAILAGITPMGISQAIKRGNITAEKLGKVWYIDSNSAMEWLLSR